MSRFSQILIGIVFVFLVILYVLFIWHLQLRAVDVQTVTKEDSSVYIKVGSYDLIKEKYKTEIVQRPDHGSVSFLLNQIHYLPDNDFNGFDKFTYRLSTDSRISDPAEVSIDMTPVNDAPVAQKIAVETAEDIFVDIQLEGKDAEDDFLSFELIEKPVHGRLSGQAPNLRYLPNENYFGKDRIIYRAMDAVAAGEPAQVSINVIPINDPPKANDLRITGYQNTALRFKFQSSDPDSENITYRVVKPPDFGKIVFQNNTPTYRPNKNFSGVDQFLFSALDGLAESDPAEVKIDIRKIDQTINLKKVLNNVLQSGGVAIGNYRKPEYLYHSGKYIPASLLKIITAAATLHYLGANYRFKTEFFIDKQKNLYIKGYGDPCLSSKNWHEIARTLLTRTHLEQDFNSLIIDTSAFSDRLNIDGRRHTIHYYDAPPSVLASNYNIIALRIKKDRQFKIIDKYTPLTSLVSKKAKRLPVGYQRFNVASDTTESIRYSAELIQEIFKEYNTFFEGKMSVGRVPKNLTPIYTFQSELSLKAVIKEMLQNSNNFIANQLLLVLAYEKKGEGANIKTGVDIVSGFLKKEIGLSHRKFKLVEGSGLSTKNNIDLLAMLKIVNYFKEYRSLLPNLRTSRYPGLAKMGRKWNILAKSGTLTNVETLAGFIQVKRKVWKPFVIMLNDNKTKRGTVMEIIARYYHG